MPDIRKRLLMAMNSHWKTNDELSSELNEPVERVKQFLKDMWRTGEIKRRKLYGVEEFIIDDLGQNVLRVIKAKLV